MNVKHKTEVFNGDELAKMQYLLKGQNQQMTHWFNCLYAE